ncbi:MAG: hypothetical protein P4M13_01525 [Alphaproteobacteria bacterium]|nr:hypothetical protein [Alphaproteobacteria bacterium]
MLKYIVLASLLLLPTLAQAQGLSGEWFKCQTDRDCVLTAGYCGDDWAVNKNYADQASKAAASVDCLKAGAHDPHAAARCVDNKCAVIHSKK